MDEIPYYPLPLLRSARLQSVLGYYLPVSRPKAATRAVIEVDSETALTALIDHPEPVNGERIILLVHGLAGCADSTYMRRFSRRLTKAGYGVVRMNLRNSGCSVGMAKSPLHAARSEDLRAVVKWIEAKYPSSPVTVLGFSFGGNISLIFAGQPDELPSSVDSVVALSPLVDLAENAQKLKEKSSRDVERFLMRNILENIQRVHDIREDLGPPDLPPGLSIEEFAKLYIIPRSGFESLAHYYQEASSIKYIPRIKIPTLVIASDKDPFIAIHPIKRFNNHPFLEAKITSEGGHVTFIGPTDQVLDFFWADRCIERWIKKR